ncbi:MAG: ribonuclease HII [Candidatus Zixiibacteriota bacterium]
MVDEANRLFDECLPQNLVLHNCGIELERRLWRQGYRTVAGVDEVGRGPLAGPVVAASVVFPQEFFLPGVDDSKKLSAAKREVLFDQILQNALEVGVGIVGEKIIDRTNILNASLAAMCQAVKQLKNPPEFVLVDGNQKIPHLSIPQTPVVKGDSISLCISAASIVAKVTRDRIMLKYHRKYPEFCFAENKGYSTKAHVQALKTFGPCKIHRKSFKLVGLCQTNQIDLRIP